MDQSETPLLDAVRSFLASEVTPFTTPGHKRHPELADELLALDLPLSGGADDLHLTGNVLGRAEALAAALWGADLCRFCTNGSTEGNQALALAIAEPGAKVIVSRSLHKSTFAGLVLADLDPVWVRPDVDAATGLALGVPPTRVEELLALHPDARAVLLVEPNFVGVISDVAAIAGACHAAGVPLVVDQAWGAHLGFHPGLPQHVLALGADAMVTSAHKTLTGFTQSAYLFARGERIDLRRLDEAFEAIHTTSVAAQILASLDRTRALLAREGGELLSRTLAIAERIRGELASIDGLVVPGSELRERPSVGHVDPTKLVLALPGTGADGIAVERDLAARGLRLELANRDTLIPLLTIGDSEHGASLLVEALRESIERRRGAARPPGGASAVWAIEPERVLSPRAAFFARRETVPADVAVGRIAAETVAPYPPGIPAIAPGERIQPGLLEALREAAADGTRLAYCADPRLETLQVVASD